MLRLESQLRKIFGHDSISWEWFANSAAAVKWSDWEYGGSKSTSLMKALAKNASQFLLLSKKESIDINILVRNAVSLTSEDQLPVARLVLTHLLHNGNLQGTAKDWLRQFPKPSSIEKFLEDHIRGTFRPNQRVFAELLKFARNTNSERNCIKNLVFSLGYLPTKACALFGTLKRQSILRTIDVNSFFPVLEEIYKGRGLEKDLDIESFLKLPKSWRTHVLANERLINYYLSPSFQKKISNDPYCLRETPSSINEAKTSSQLKSELKGRKINPETIRHIINSEGMLEKLDKSFEWSVLKNKINPRCLGYQNSANKAWIEVLKGKFQIPSASNLFLLHLVWLSVTASHARPYKDPGELVKCLTYGSPEAISFCVRNARGRIQRDVIMASERDPLSRFNKLEVTNWFLEGEIDDETDIETLLWVLSLVTEDRKTSLSSVVISKELLALGLLQHSDEFRSFYLSKLETGKFPEYAISEKAFRVYGKLEEFGGTIIETILTKLNKFSGRVKAEEIFQRTIRAAPGAVVKVFGNRGFSPEQFADLLSSKEFGRLSKNIQMGIFELKAPNGKSAFREAIRKGKVEPDLIRKIERSSHLKRYLVRYCPASLTTRKTSVAENLAALVYRPSESDNFAETYTKTDQLRALPKALKFLEDRGRVSAALELAVHSKLSALPIFLQLVQKLAPPFLASDLGHRFDDLYTTYELPKKSGGNRTISAPAPHLKLAQRALLTILNEEEYSDAATGFRQGKSILDNAACHIGKEVVVNADIKGFFPSTTYKLVYFLARRVARGKLSPLAARLFAEICCHNGHLATGAPTSPAVSNLIFKPIDDILTKISKKLDVSYSRYADDMTFSGDSAAVWMLKPLEFHLARFGYELEPKKTNIFRKGRRQTVTGAVVNEKVTLARPLRKKLRAAVYRRLNGEQPEMHGKPLSDQALLGHLAYLSMLSPEHAKPFLAKLEKLEEWKP